jgi:hypothetical protein
MQTRQGCQRTNFRKFLSFKPLLRQAARFIFQREKSLRECGQKKGFGAAVVALRKSSGPGRWPFSALWASGKLGGHIANTREKPLFCLLVIPQNRKKKG